MSSPSAVIPVLADLPVIAVQKKTSYLPWFLFGLVVVSLIIVLVIWLKNRSSKTAAPAPAPSHVSEVQPQIVPVAQGIVPAVPLIGKWCQSNTTNDSCIMNGFVLDIVGPVGADGKIAINHPDGPLILTSPTEFYFEKSGCKCKIIDQNHLDVCSGRAVAKRM